MKIIPNQQAENFSLPLPIYTSVHLADAVDKAGEEYGVYIGLEKNQVEQLKKLSLDVEDVELQNNTGDRRRFGEGSYDEWYSKNRTPFILIHKKTGNLAALVWFGPKSLGKKSIKFGSEEVDVLQDNWHTAVWRSYPNYRGKGLMINFTLFVMEEYQKHFSDISFWAGTDVKNISMITLSSKLGFEVDQENSDLSADWLVVVRK